MLEFHSATIDMIGKTHNVDQSMYRSASLGAMEFGLSSFVDYVDVTCDDVGSGYFVQLPLAGRTESRHRGVALTAEPGTAAVYQPDGGAFRGRFAVDYRGLCLRIDGAQVHGALERLLDDSLTGRISFEHAMDVATGRGRAWAELVVAVSRQLALPGHLLAEPMVTAPLAESLTHGFVLATRHSRSAALTRPGGAAGPRYIRRAVDLVEADPKAPWTVTLLAERCQVTVRTLQAAFRRHLDTTPMGHVRTVRLRKAHEELLAAEPDATTVAGVAGGWGFPHAGRFSAMYRAAYGRTPASALRGQRASFPGQRRGGTA